MSDLKEFSSHYVNELGGPNNQDAWHSLVEADDAIIPFLVEAYRSEADPKRRSLLVNVIWEHRVPESLEFLAEALGDPVDEVWKSALDGIVAIGGPIASGVLESARHRIETDNKGYAERIEWIDEGIQQIRDERQGSR